MDMTTADASLLGRRGVAITLIMKVNAPPRKNAPPQPRVNPVMAPQRTVSRDFTATVSRELVRDALVRRLTRCGALKGA